MDIVYIVGYDSEHLKYSLRSLENIPHDRVWIVGYEPKWVKNVMTIQVRQNSSKWNNQKNNFRAACLDSRISDDFMLFNDDFYVMKPIDYLPVYHRGELWRVAQTLSNRYDSWARGLVHTSRSLGDNALAYDAIHVPMTFNKKELKKLLNDIPQNHLIRSWYGNKLEIGGIQRKDAKRRQTARLENVDDDFFSTSPQSFEEHWAGDLVKSTFPEPCGYEK